MEETRGGRAGTVLFLLGAVVLAGTLGFRLLLQLSWVEAIYLAVVTLTTVGYGDITPLMRVRETGGSETLVLGFTVLLVLSGMGIFAYTASELTEYILSGRYERDRNVRRIRRAVHRLGGHVIVCGGGTAARHMMRELQRTGRPFVCLDERPATLETLRGDFPDLLSICGDPLEEQTLVAAGLPRAGGLLLAFEEEKDNLLLAMTVRAWCEARQLPLPRMVSRVRDREAGAERLKAAGAVSAVSSSFIGGRRMASEMLRPTVTSFLDRMLSEDSRNVRVEEIRVETGSAHIGGSLGQNLAGLCPLALYRDGECHCNPPAETVLAAGDVFVVVGAMKEIIQARRRLAAC